MLPALSIAMLPIQRCCHVAMVGSCGANVPCWNTAHASLPERRSSNQRMPAWSMPSTSTTKLPTRLSWLPKLRYWSRHIGHSLTGSSLVDVPGWGMQAKLKKPQRAESNAASGMLVGPLKLEAAGVAQSAWDSQISLRSVPPKLFPSTWREEGFAEPVGRGL